MFSFLNDLDDYEERKVARYEKDDLMVDTARVSDGVKPFETAIEHPNYNGGEMVIVENYDTIKQAKSGHKKWVELMTSFPLPTELPECGNAMVMQFGKKVLGEDFIQPSQFTPND